MARDITSLKLYCSAVLSSHISPWSLDPKCVPIPWRTSTITPPNRKLRIGIIGDDDGQHTVHPPISRGLLLTRVALEAVGHEVFSWAPTTHPEICALTGEAFVRLGGAAIMKLTKEHDEPVFGSMKPYEHYYEAGENDTLGPTKLREMIVRRNALQKKYSDRWNETGKEGKGVMDAIVCASSVWTAPRAGVTQDTFSVNWTSVWNLLGKTIGNVERMIILTSAVLDYAVCTFPVTFADKEKDQKRTNWAPLNELDGRLQADYDPDFCHDTPVVLQCVGRRLEEEKVLDMTEIISTTVKDYLSRGR